MQKALHPRDDINWVYVSRKERGRGLNNIEDCVDISIKRLKVYIKKNKEILTIAPNNSIGKKRPDWKTTIRRK